MTSAYASYLTTYGVWSSYLTVTEFRNAPLALDLSNLVPGGAAAQETAIKETIHRVSSWIDGYVTGSAYNTINATSNVENARVWGNRSGQLIIHPRLWPILEVSAFSYSTLPTGVGAASITPSGNIWIEPQQFIVQPAGVINWGAAAPMGLGIATCQYFCEWTYVNGFSNTTFTASVAAGATSASVENALGIYPTMPMEIFDAPDDEQVITSPTYSPIVDLLPTSGVVQFAHPLKFNHAAGAVLTNMPKAVKQAAILLTGSIIKQRGSGSMVVADMGAVSNQQKAQGIQGSSGDIELAMELLGNLKQKFMGY